jgi:hypothetical protein
LSGGGAGRAGKVVGGSPFGVAVLGSARLREEKRARREARSPASEQKER